MSERTEKEILTELSAAKEKFAELAANPESTTLAAQQAAVQEITKLGQELDQFISQGAEPCANPRAQVNAAGEMETKSCGERPMGMLKTPAYERDGIEVPAVWEVGCIHCAPYLVEHENGTAVLLEGEVKKVKRRSFSARANSPAEAVKKWNAGELVEDFYLDRIPGYTPEYAPAESSSEAKPS